MKSLLVFLLFSVSVQAQNPCEDFLVLLGQRDISEVVSEFKSNCGPFVETIADDASKKTWANSNSGITVTFINRNDVGFGLSKYDVLMVELRAFTDSGGYKGAWPLGFELGMNHKLVKKHIQNLESVSYEKKQLGKQRSSFVYTGSSNSALGNRQIRFSIVQLDGKSITSMWMRLK